MDEILAPNKAASYLNVRVRTFSRLAKEGKIPGVKHEGSALDTGHSLLKLRHLLPKFSIFPHPLLDPCPNLGNRRVANSTEISADLRVRGGCCGTRGMGRIPKQVFARETREGWVVVKPFSNRLGDYGWWDVHK